MMHHFNNNNNNNIIANSRKMDLRIRNGSLITCSAPIKRLILYLNRDKVFGKIFDIVRIIIYIKFELF